jgi:hypothetical protein
MRRFSIFLVVVALVAIGVSGAPTMAAEKLIGTGLEESAGPAGWTLTQSIVEMPGAFANATEHLDGANQEPAPAEGLGLLVRPFAGNVGTFAGNNFRLNLTLTQTAAVSANRTFTFTGNSLVQASSSVIVDTLEALTPLGDYNLDSTVNAADYTVWRDTLGSTTDFRANGTNEGASLDLIDQADYDYWKERFGDAGHPAGTPSPTQTHFTIEFLNASNVVLATHSIDLRADPTVDAWRTQTLGGMVSPAGTTKARVSAVLTDGVASCSMCAAGSDLLLDNFSLRDNVVPGLERLANANLNTLGAPSGWVIEKTGQDNLSFAGSPSFAANTGNVGMWLRAFSGGDAKILQTVAATPGASYDFSAFSKWEQGYIDLDPLHPETETTMTLEYLDASSVVIGAPLVLNLLGPDGLPGGGDDLQMGDGMWRQLTLDGGTAPAGTAFVRVSAGAIMMGNSGVDPQSAFFDDFSLNETLAGAGGLAAAGVPEPSSVLLVGIALGMFGVGRRRW